MIRLPEQIEDVTLAGAWAAGCCTSCSRHLVDGEGIQWQDQRGRVHRHCPRCHGELMKAHDAIAGELSAATVQEILL
jgi:hypothetical protein